jgi:hypothetical protein
MSSLCDTLSNYFKSSTEILVDLNNAEKFVNPNSKPLGPEHIKRLSSDLRTEALQKRRRGHGCMFIGAVGVLAAIIATGGVALGGGIVAGVFIFLAICLYAKARNLQNKANSIHIGSL